MHAPLFLDKGVLEIWQNAWGDSAKAEKTEILPNVTDYDETYRNFRINVPEYFNFGFDVIDAWAKKDRNKLAMIWVNQKGEEKKFTFWDLSRLSNQVANMSIRYGINKGDRVLIMLPRVPEWWIFTLALSRGVLYIALPRPCSPRRILNTVSIPPISR